MIPVLFKIGGLHITSWGVCFVIGVFICIKLGEIRGKKYNTTTRTIGDLAVVLILSGVVGGRLFYVIEDINYYSTHPIEIIKVWEGGLIFYGGLIFGIIGGIIFLRRKKLSVSHFMDLIAPIVPIGLAVARVGCFLNGCCFGKETKSLWGIEFPPNSYPTMEVGGKIYPTQLWSSVIGVGIFFVLQQIEKKGKYKKGGLFFLFLLLYSGWRVVVDYFRYYTETAYIIKGITHNQLISITMFITALLLYKKLKPYT